MVLRWVGLLGLLAVVLPCSAQTEVLSSELEAAARKLYNTPTLYGLWRDYQQDDQAIADFYQGLKQKHLVEDHPEQADKALVTYFARGDEHSAYLLQSGGPDFYGLRFQALGDSGYYFCTQTIPRDAWFSYGVNDFRREAVDGAKGLWQASMQHIIDGSVIGPDAPLSPWLEPTAGANAGAVLEASVDSETLGETRPVLVYTPPSFDASQPHQLLVQLDGQNFASAPDQGPAWQAWTPLPTILDQLHAHRKIAPTVALLVLNQGNRSGDMLDDAFTDFLALELLPWAKQHDALPAISRVVISGPSRAAYAAANTALRHPSKVDGVLAQSGSFYYTLDEQRRNWPVYPAFEGHLLEAFKASPRLPVDFYLNVGLYDLGLGRVGVNRQLRDILRLKGHRVGYREYNGGHSHLNWRHTLADGLMFHFSHAMARPGTAETGP